MRRKLLGSLPWYLRNGPRPQLKPGTHDAGLQTQFLCLQPDMRDAADKRTGTGWASQSQQNKDKLKCQNQFFTLSASAVSYCLGVLYWDHLLFDFEVQGPG